MIDKLVLREHAHIQDKEMRKYDKILRKIQYHHDISIADLFFWQRRYAKKIHEKISSCVLCNERWRDYSNQEKTD